MKTWSVIFRNSKGERETITISADNRSNVFKECNKLGINNVIRISETESKKKYIFLRHGSQMGKWCLLTFVFLAVVCLCLYFLTDNKQKIKEPIKQKKVVKTTRRESNQPSPDKPVAATPEKAKREKSAPDTNKVWITKRSYIAKMKNGKTKTVIIDDPDKIKEPPIFKSGVNNFLTNYMIPGEPVPPTPISFSNEEVLQALMEKVEITDEDSEKVRYAKESILIMRDELKETIKNGGTLSDYISDLQRRQDLEAAVVQESRQMIMQELRNESPARAKELYDNINKYLNEKGLPGVRIPKKFLKLMNEGVQ